MNSTVDKYRQYLTASGQTDDRSDMELTLALGDRARATGSLADQPDDFKNDYYQIKQAMEPGFTDGLEGAAVKGYERGMQGLSAAVAPEALAGSIAERQKVIDAHPSGEATQEFEEAKGFLPSLKAFVSHPLDITAQTVVQSLGQSWPAILAQVGGGIVGGMTGTEAEPGYGTAIGSGLGAGAGSALVDFSGKILDSMQQAGMDIRDPASIKKFFNDPGLVDRARDIAAKHAIPTAVFNAITAGFAGRFAGPLKDLAAEGLSVPITQTAGAIGKELALQAAGGVTSDVAGRLATGEPQDPKAEALAAIGALGNAPFEIATNLGTFRAGARDPVVEPTAAAVATPVPVAPPRSRPAAPMATTTDAEPTRGDMVRSVLALSDDDQKLRAQALQRMSNRSPAEDEELRLLTNLNAGKPGFAAAAAEPAAAVTPAVPAPIVAPAPEVAVATPAAPGVQPAAPEAAPVPQPQLVAPLAPPPPPPPLSPEAITQKVQNLGNRIVRLEQRGGDPRGASSKLDAMTDSGVFTREGLQAVEDDVTAQEQRATVIQAKVKSGRASMISDRDKIVAQNLRAELAQKRAAVRLAKLKQGLSDLAAGDEAAPEAAADAAAATPPAGPGAPPAPASPLRFGRLIDSPQFYTLTAEQAKTSDWEGAFKTALGLDQKAQKGAGLRTHNSTAWQSTVGIALLDPKTGAVYLRGLRGDTVSTLSTDGTNKAGLAIQGMGRDGGPRVAKLKVITPEGAKPALLSEVVQSGFVPIGRVNFEKAGKISEDFASRDAFAASANATEIAAKGAEEGAGKVAAKAANDAAAVGDASTPEQAVAAEAINRREQKAAAAGKQSDQTGPVVYNSETADAAANRGEGTGMTPMERGAETPAHVEGLEESTPANRYGEGPWEVQKLDRGGDWETVREIGLEEKTPDRKGKATTRAVGEDTIRKAYEQELKGNTGTFRIADSNLKEYDRVTQRRTAKAKIESEAPVTDQELATAHKLLSETAKSETGRANTDWYALLKRRSEGLDESRIAALLKDFLLGTGSFKNINAGPDFVEISGGYAKANRILHDTLTRYEPGEAPTVSAARDQRPGAEGRPDVQAEARGAGGDRQASGPAGEEGGGAGDAARDSGTGRVGDRGSEGHDLDEELSARVGEATAGPGWPTRLKAVYRAIDQYGKGKFDAGLVSRFPEAARDAILNLVSKAGVDWDDFAHHVQSTFDVSRSPEEFAALVRGEEPPATPEPVVIVKKSTTADDESDNVISFGENRPPHEVTGGVPAENTFNPISGRVENPTVLPMSRDALHYNLDEAARRGRQVKVDESAPAAYEWQSVPESRADPETQSRIEDFEHQLNVEMREQKRPLYRIREVEPAEAGNETATFGAGGGDLPGRGLVENNFATAARLIGKVFGKRVAFVDITGGDGLTFRGLTNAGRNDTILINAKSSVSMLQVVGHELTHNMAEERPDLFKVMRDYVRENAPMPDDYVERKQGMYSADEIETEWVADVVGERFAEPEFWESLQDRVAGSDASASQKAAMMNLATYVGAWVRRVFQSIKKFLANTTPEVRDLGRLQDTIADVMSDYGASAPYSKMMKGELDGVNLSATKEMDYVEARARVESSAWNAVLPTIEDAAKRLMPKSVFEDFWRIVAGGDTPQEILDEIEKRSPGASRAAINDAGHTSAVRSQAVAEGYKIARGLETNSRGRAARAVEVIKKTSDALDDLVARFTKTEREYMNADAMQAGLHDALKSLLRDTAKDVDRVGRASFASGELTQAVRSLEGLSEGEAIPEEYQAVFKKVLTSENTSVFDHLSDLAQLDLPLKEMTAPAIVKAMADSSVANLTELAKNRPLALALAVLARNKTKEMDLMQLRLMRDSARSLAIKQQLNALRSASDARLEALWPALRDMRNSQSIADRLQAAYVEDRRNLRRTQTALKTASQRESANRMFADAVGKVREQLGQQGGDYATWAAADGSEYKAMRFDDAAAKWVADTRTLRMAGDEVTAQHEQIAQDIASNRYWMGANPDQRGTPHYNLVELQTQELANIDVSRRYEAANRWFMDKLISPVGQKFSQMGGAAGQQVAQMFQRYQFITKNGPWHDELIARSKRWSKGLQDVLKASGISTPQEFFRNVYDQVIYGIENNPGADEAGALRSAIRAGRERLDPGKSDDSFSEKMGDFLRQTKGMSEYMLKVAQENGVHIEDREVKNLMRNAIEYGWLTVPRKLRSEVVTDVAAKAKAAGWGEKMFDTILPKGETPPVESVESFAERVFTPDVVRTFVEPFINKPGKEVFFGADRSGGSWSFLSQVEAQAAWEKASASGHGGDVLKFIDELFHETYEPSKDADPAKDQNAYRIAMLKRFGAMQGMISNLERKINKPALFEKGGALPHRLMDGRTNDLIPPEFFNYDAFDTRNAEIGLAEIGYHGAFGRNGTKFNEAVTSLGKDLSLRAQKYDQLLGITQAQKKAEAIARGWDWDNLRTAKRDQQRLNGIMKQVGMHFGGNGIVMGDERAILNMLQTQAALVLNQPTSGLWNVPSIFDYPLLLGLGPSGIKSTGRTLGHLIKGVFGSALGAANINLLRASTYAAEIASMRLGEQQKLSLAEHMTDIGRGGNYYEGGIANRTTQGSKFIQNLMRRGVGNDGGFLPFNGLWAPFHYISEQVATAIATSNVENFELMVKRSADFFKANPEAARSPAYRLSAKDLGMVGPAFFTDERAFEYYRAKAFEYGMGPIEDIARGQLEKGGPLLSKQQVLSVAQMAFNEISLESSINSRPIEWSNNPLLRYGGMLLGWPIAKMHQVNTALKTVDGRKNLGSVARGVATLAAWSLPLGLAYSFLMDDWDENVVGKRSNRRDIDKVAGVPFVGPMLALAGGDRGFKGNLFGMLERAAKAGNIYGLGADFANSLVNVVDPTAGQRDFSLDSRVLAFSQFANLRDMMRNLIHQDFTYTYDSVGRPLALALGGNGLIQAQQIFDNALGLDNEEHWIADRINVGNYLRAAGREVGLERKGDAGRSAPTPMSVWEREMYLAALGNDRMKFLEAYRAAVAAARDGGQADPENAVLESWRSRNPLSSVFRTKPTDEDVARLMNAMDDRGQDAVRSAIRSYDNFSDMIEPGPAELAMRRAMNPPKIPSLMDVRRRAASMSFSR